MRVVRRRSADVGDRTEDAADGGAVVDGGEWEVMLRRRRGRSVEVAWPRQRRRIRFSHVLQV